MKKLTTRMLSIMTTIVMILTMLPLTAFADKTKVQIVNAYELATKSKLTIGDGYTLNAEDYWCIIHTSDVKRHVKHKKRENPKKAVKKQNTPYKLRIYGVYEV